MSLMALPPRRNSVNSVNPARGVISLMVLAVSSNLVSRVNPVSGLMSLI